MQFRGWGQPEAPPLQTWGVDASEGSLQSLDDLGPAFNTPLDPGMSGAGSGDLGAGEPWQVRAPRVLGAEEALGPRDPSKWNRLAAAAQPATLSKRDRFAMRLRGIMGGMARGAAAATGIPAWQRAAAQVQQRDEMAAGMEASERKSRLSYLADLAERQQAEEKRYADYAQHPMSEYDGQQMPLTAAIGMETQRQTARLRGEQEEWRRAEAERDQSEFETTEARLSASAAAADADRDAARAQSQQNFTINQAGIQRRSDAMMANRESQQAITAEYRAARAAAKTAGGEMAWTDLLSYAMRMLKAQNPNPYKTWSPGEITAEALRLKNDVIPELSDSPDQFEGVVRGLDFANNFNLQQEPLSQSWRVPRVWGDDPSPGFYPSDDIEEEGE